MLCQLSWDCFTPSFTSLALTSLFHHRSGIQESICSLLLGEVLGLEVADSQAIGSWMTSRFMNAAKARASHASAELLLGRLVSSSTPLFLTSWLGSSLKNRSPSFDSYHCIVKRRKSESRREKGEDRITGCVYT